MTISPAIAAALIAISQVCAGSVNTVDTHNSDNNTDKRGYKLVSEVCLDDIEYQVEDIEAANGLNADYYGIGIIFSENDGSYSVTEDIILPDRGYYNNSYIKWHSSDPETVSDDGKVTPPKGESRIVTLTADVTPTEEYLECSADDGVINAFKKDINLVVVKEFEAKPLPPVDDDILNSLEQRTSIRVYFNDDGTINSISANYADYKVESTREAIYSLNAVKHLYGIKDPENEYELQALNVSGGYPNNDIMRFFRLQQVYKGVPVYGSVFVVHAYGDGTLGGVSGKYDNIPDDFDTVPKSTYEQVWKAAGMDIDSFDKNSLIRDNDNKVIGYYYGDVIPVYFEKPKLYIYETEDGYTLAWEVINYSADDHEDDSFVIRDGDCKILSSWCSTFYD